VILQALVNYYDILNRAGKISEPGYSKANVSFALNLSVEGKLLNIIPLKIMVQKGKKSVEIPQSMQVPEQIKRSVNIQSNFLCDNATYFLGIDSKGKAERAKLCFEDARKLHISILEGVDCVEAKAVVAFFDNWNQDDAKEIESSEYIEQVSSGVNLVFHIEGYGFAHENKMIQMAWNSLINDQQDATNMQCLVTGQNGPVARLHPSIKGVKGAQSSGASLVSFNDAADCSYGRDGQQGSNAPVSERATFAYSTALNFLLSDTSHKCTLGDTTVVYWAESAKPIYRDMFGFALDPKTEESNDSAEMEESKSTTKILQNIFEKIVNGSQLSDVSEIFDKNTTFYILGLSPNAARLSVRFFMQDSFGTILERIAAHYQDLEIEKAPYEPRLLPLWKLMLETVSPNSRDKASSPLLSGSVMRSILSGACYPTALFSNVFVRIRAERNITYGKAAIIKAYLIRKFKEEKIQTEVLTVSLNETSENRAYVLGRLFSVLEKLQLEANPGINSTIKDKYFTSACATPAAVFPILLRLANHHSSKAQYGYTYENKIRDLLDKVLMDEQPFPSHLSLDQQGVFVLGYYHQYQANYRKSIKEEK